MSSVKAKPGESFESLMRRFKKAVERSGILADARKYEYYEKPSVKRKREQAANKKRSIKRQQQLERISARKGSNKNFKWNKDQTKKLPLPPPRKDYKKPTQNRSRFIKNPSTNKGTKQ